MTSDQRAFKQGPLILPEGWSLSAKLTTLKDSDKKDGDSEVLFYQILHQLNQFYNLIFFLCYLKLIIFIN